jgi:hypothetical protein
VALPLPPPLPPLRFRKGQTRSQHSCSSMHGSVCSMRTLVWHQLLPAHLEANHIRQQGGAGSKRSPAAASLSGPFHDYSC